MEVLCGPELQSRIEPGLPRIILASASPRRRDLLSGLVEAFTVIPSDIPEPALPDPWQTAETLALAKAELISEHQADAIVIGADTVVAYEDSGWHQLAKPGDEEDAAQMLLTLSGKTHSVITGLAVLGPDIREVLSETTKVTFRALSEGEIRDYVATGEPMDKAGAYAIQGGAAGFVDRVEGSLSNVIGLPLEVLRPILMSTGVVCRSLPND